MDMFNLNGENIIDEIAQRAYENAEKNVNKVGKLMMSVNPATGKTYGEEITPIELLNGMVNYMQTNTQQKLPGYSEFEDELTSKVLNSSEMQKILHGDKHPMFEIGLALIAAGNKLMELEHNEEEIIREKLKDNTLTKKDAEDLIEANLRGIPEDLAPQFKAILSGATPKATAKVESTRSSTKVTDRNSVISLVKDSRISTSTLYVLLQSREVTVAELRDNLDADAFEKTMNNVNTYAKENGKAPIVIPPISEATETESDCHDCDNCDSKELCGKINNGIEGLFNSLEKMKQDMSDKLIEKSLDESKINEDEKILRRAIDRGYVTDEQIVKAVSENKLNPFYLEATIKKTNPARYARISIMILKENAPDVLSKLGDDPFKTIMDRMRKES